MGLVFGKRIRIGANETVNLSKGGASVAKRVGHVTVTRAAEARPGSCPVSASDSGGGGALHE
jgi:hypothetical protein